MSSIESTNTNIIEQTTHKWTPLTRRQSFYSLQIDNKQDAIPYEDKLFGDSIYAKPEMQREEDLLRIEKKEFSKSSSSILYEKLINSLPIDDADDETYEGVSKLGNIILDMDGTLGDYIPAEFEENPERYCNAKPIPRPGLRKFLRFVFSHFERVSIWTAASYSWYNTFKKDVLLPNMPPGSEFHFVRTRNMKEPYVVLKPLTKIYELYPEYTAENTTIVDDNVWTFADNRENAVHIPPFFYDKFGGSPATRIKNAAKDRELFTTIEVIQARIRTKMN
jgi:TFIIF-interacting CTD phosphatase-like protein